MFSLLDFNLFFTSFISFLIILVLHYLWEYIKDTYSTKKVKDLVNTQIEKYKIIASNTITDKGSPSQDFLTEEEKTFMHDDLQNYANSLTDKK